jgi:hypothetical protein
VDNELFTTVACVLFKNIDKVWFEPFDDNEIDETVLAVF